MKLKFTVLVFSLLLTSLSHAQRCQIDRSTVSELKLNSSYLSQAATSFIVRCDSSYAIQFNSRNLTSTNGSSYLVNEHNHKIRTQMYISGATSSRWNMPISQPATNLNKFVVLVQLAEQPSALTPAGVYKDSLYVDLIY